MTMPANTSAAPEFDCRYPIVGWSAVRLTLPEIAQTRKTSANFFPPNATPIALKHCEDQTVAALAAVFRAIDHFQLAAVDFAAWSIVAAPRFFGRAMVSQTLDRFAIDGAWGVSMQFIPNAMHHAQASTLSLALGARGAAIGVGGGSESERDGALAALNVLQRQRSKGAWLVWTGWEPEYVVAANRPEPINEPSCLALAMAIDGAPSERPGSSLHVRMRPAASANDAAKSAPRASRLSLLSHACHEARAIGERRPGGSRGARILLTAELGGGLTQQIELHSATADALAATHAPAISGAPAPLGLAANRNDATLSSPALQPLTKS